MRIDMDTVTHYCDPMNLQSALSKLNQIGMTDKQIGDEIGGVSQSMITRLRNGVHKTTSFERGQAIFKLVQEKAPEPPCQSTDNP